MVDCAQNLHTGAEMLLQLRVFILADAFRPHSPSPASNDVRSMFNEGQESLDEQALRERKASLLQLFQVIGLNPRRPNAFLRDSCTSVDSLELTDGDRPSPNDKGKKKTKREAFGEGDDHEEVEDEAEVLSEGQLDMIYQKLVGCGRDYLF